jgi:phytoene synthase
MTDPIVAHCRTVIEGGSKSFARAARLLDPEARAGAYQLYAWCRYCDDVIDAQTLGHGQQRSDPAAQAERLASLRETTEDALAGHPVDGLVFQGIARIVRRYDIPRRHPFELLDGMAMDVAGRRYPTFDDLRVYCYHVAGVVGVMMAHIMGIKDQPTLARAEDLGTAMQVTNIARDVIDDARVGRVYLPLGWLAEQGVPPDRVADPVNRPAVARVVDRLLDRADGFYRSADSGIAHLPFRSAWSITTARWIYSDIGKVIRRRGPAAWDRRAWVGSGRKLWWVGRSLARTITARLTSRNGAGYSDSADRLRP